VAYDCHELHSTSYASCLPYFIGALHWRASRLWNHETGRNRLTGKGVDGPGHTLWLAQTHARCRLVQESDKRVDPEMDDERRIYYQITGIGAQALESELDRYKRIVTIAQQRKLFPKTFAYD